MRLIATILGCLALAAPLQVRGQTTTPSSAAAIVVVRGEIDDFNKRSVEKRFEEARAIGAKTIILQINTYGGLVTSGLEISQFLKRQSDLHVIAYVDEKAISAGAMIALACNEIVMQPGSKLGDCAPIAIASTGDLQTLGDAERAKAESPILEDFYDSAIRNGYDPLLAQSMVSTKRIVHWIEDSSGQRRFVDAANYSKLILDGWKPVENAPDPVDGADTLLTIGADLAKKLGLAKGIEPSAQSLATSRGLHILATLEPSGGEKIVGFLGSSAVRALLTSVFLLSLYLAFSHPGHGGPEVAATCALVILLGIPLLTGYAQWWEILAILLGLILLAIELFVIPGFGFTGITGICLVMMGLIMTFVPSEPPEIPGILPSLPATISALKQGTMIVLGGMISSLLLWVWLQRYLPSLPYFNRLILTAGGPATEAVPEVVSTEWPMVGVRGRVVTDLRPGGTAAFYDAAINDERIADVVSESGFLPAGAAVIVRESRPNHIVVRSAQA